MNDRSNTSQISGSVKSGTYATPSALGQYPNYAGNDYRKEQTNSALTSIGNANSHSTHSMSHNNRDIRTQGSASKGNNRESHSFIQQSRRYKDDEDPRLIIVQKNNLTQREYGIDISGSFGAGGLNNYLNGLNNQTYLPSQREGLEQMQNSKGRGDLSNIDYSHHQKVNRFDTSPSQSTYSNNQNVIPNTQNILSPKSYLRDRQAVHKQYQLQTEPQLSSQKENSDLNFDMQEILLSLHNKMKSLENKYIDLANFYKMGAIKQKQLISLNNNLSDSKKSPNRMIFSNTADNFYSQKHSQNSPLKFQNQAALAQEEFDTVQEKNLISDLLNEKTGLDLELENIVKLQQKIQEQDQRIHDKLDTIEQEYQQIKGTVNQQRGNSSTINERDILNIQNQVQQIVERFEEGLIRYINDNYNTFTENDIVGLFSNLKQEILNSISEQLQFHSFTDTSRFPAQVAYQNDQLSQQSMKLLQQYKKDQNEFEINQEYSLQKIKKTVFDLQNKQELTLLDLKKTQMLIQNINKSSDELCQQTQKQKDMMRANISSPRTHAITQDSLAIDIQSQIKLLSSSFSSLNSKVISQNQELTGLTNIQDEFSSNLGQLKRNFTKLLDLFDSPQQNNLGSSLTSINDRQTSDLSARRTMKDIDELQILNKKLQSELQHANNQLKKLQSQNDNLINDRSNINNMRVKDRHNNRNDSLDNGIHRDQLIRLQDQNVSLERKVQSLSRCLDEKNEHLIKLGRDLNNVSQQQNLRNLQIQNQDKNVSLDQLNFYRNFADSQQHKLRNLIRQTQKFLYSMKKLQKAVHKKEPNVQKEKSEFEDSRKELESMLRQFKRELDENLKANEQSDSYMKQYDSRQNASMYSANNRLQNMAENNFSADRPNQRSFMNMQGVSSTSYQGQQATSPFSQNRPSHSIYKRTNVHQQEQYQQPSYNQYDQHSMLTAVNPVTDLSYNYNHRGNGGPAGGASNNANEKSPLMLKQKRGEQREMFKSIEPYERRGGNILLTSLSMERQQQRSPSVGDRIHGASSFNNNNNEFTLTRVQSPNGRQLQQNHDIDILLQQIKELKYERESTNLKLMKVERDKDSYMLQKQQLDHELERQKRVLDQQREEITELVDEKAQLKEEIDKLIAALQSQQNSNNLHFGSGGSFTNTPGSNNHGSGQSSFDQILKIRRLDKELKEANEKNERLFEQVQMNDRINAEFKRTIGILEDSVESGRRTISDQKDLIAQKEKQLQEYKIKIAGLKEEVKDIERQVQSSDINTDGKIDVKTKHLQTQLETLIHGNELALQQKYDELDKMIDNQSQEVSKLKRIVERKVKEREMQMVNLQSETSKVNEKELQSYKAQVTDLSTQLQTLQSDLLAKEKELSAYQQQHNLLSVDHSQLKQDFSTLEIQHNDLSTQLDQLKLHQAKIDMESNEKMKQLQIQMDTNKKQLNSQIQSKEQEIVQLKEEIQALEQEIQQKEQHINNSLGNKDVETLQLRNQIKQLETQVKQKELQLQELVNQHQIAMDELRDEHQQELEGLEAINIDEQKKLRQEHKQEIQKLQSQHKKDLHSLNNDFNQQLQNELDAKDQEMQQQLDNELTQLRNCMTTDFQQQISTLKSKHELEKQQLKDQFENKLSQQISELSKNNDQVEMLQQIHEQEKHNWQLEKQKIDIQIKEDLIKHKKTLQGKESELKTLRSQFEEQIQDYMEQIQSKDDQLASLTEQKDNQINQLNEKLKLLTADRDSKVKAKEQEIQNLKVQIEQLQDDIQGIQEKVNEQEQQRIDLEHKLQAQQIQTDKQIKSHLREIQQLKDQNAILIQQKDQNINYLQDQLQELEHTIQESQSSQSTLEQHQKLQIDQLKSQLANKEKDLQNLTSTYKSLESQVQSLQDELSDKDNQLHSLQNDIQDQQHKWQQRLSKAEQDKEVVQHKLQDCQDKLAKEQEKVSLLNDQISEKTQEITELKNKIGVLESKVDNLSKEKDKLVKDLKQMQNEKAQSAQDLDSQVQQLQQQNDELQQQLNEYEKSYQELQQYSEQLQQDNEDKLKTLHTLEQTNNDLQKSISKQSNKLKEIEAKVVELQEQINSKDSEIEELTDKINEQTEDIEIKGQSICDLNEKLQGCNSQIQQLQKNLKQIENQQEEQLLENQQKDNLLEQKSQQIQNLQDRLSEVENETTMGKTIRLSMQEQLEKAQREFHEKEKVVLGREQQLRNEIDELKQQLSTFEEEKDSLQQQIDKLNADLITKSKAAKEQEHQIKELNQQNISLQLKYETTIKETQDSHTEEIEQLNEMHNKQLKDKQEEIKKLQHSKEQEKSSLTAELQNLQKQHETLKVKNEELLLKIQEMKDQGQSQLDSDLQTLTQKLENVNEQLQQKEEEIEALTNKADELDLQVKQYQDNQIDYELKIQQLQEEFESLQNDYEEKNEIERQKYNQTLESNRNIIQMLKTELQKALELQKNQENQKVEKDSEREQDLVNQVSTLQGQISNLRQDFDHKVKDYQSQIESLEQEIKGKNELIDECNQLMEEFNDEKHEIKAKFKHLIQVMDNVQDESSYKEDDDVDMEECFEKFEREFMRNKQNVEQKIVTLEKDNSILRQEAQMSKAELEQIQIKMAELQAELMNALNRHDSNDLEMRKKLDNASKKMQQYKDKIVELQKVKMEMENTMKQLIELQQRNSDNLESSRTTSHKEKNDLMGKLQAAQNEILQLKQKQELNQKSPTSKLAAKIDPQTMERIDQIEMQVMQLRKQIFMAKDQVIDQLSDTFAKKIKDIQNTYTQENVLKGKLSEMKTNQHIETLNNNIKLIKTFTFGNKRLLVVQAISNGECYIIDDSKLTEVSLNYLKQYLPSDEQELDNTFIHIDESQQKLLDQLNDKLYELKEQRSKLQVGLTQIRQKLNGGAQVDSKRDLMAIQLEDEVGQLSKEMAELKIKNKDHEMLEAHLRARVIELNEIIKGLTSHADSDSANRKMIKLMEDNESLKRQLLSQQKLLKKNQNKHGLDNKIVNTLNEDDEMFEEGDFFFQGIEVADNINNRSQQEQEDANIFDQSSLYGVIEGINEEERKCQTQQDIRMKQLEQQLEEYQQKNQTLQNELQKSQQVSLHQGDKAMFDNIKGTLIQFLKNCPMTDKNNEILLDIVFEMMEFTEPQIQEVNDKRKKPLPRSGSVSASGTETEEDGIKRAAKKGIFGMFKKKEGSSTRKPEEQIISPIRPIRRM